MTIAFDWRYELVAFNPEQIKNAIDTDGEAPLDFCTAPNEAKVITELNIMADIKSSKEKKKNSSKSTISLYNCSDDTLFFLQERNTVILRAGYASQDVLPLLFVGTITKSSSEKQGADTLTTLELEDGKYARNHARLALSLPAETFTYKQVIDALLAQAGKWGVPSEFVTQEGIINEIIQGGITLEGELFRQLEKFCNDIQYKVVYHLGRVRVEPKKFDNSTQALVINENNILHGIHYIEDSKGKTQRDTEQHKGVEFTTFLNGSINIGGDITNGIDLNTPVLIDIERFAGLYDVSSIHHKLNYEGSVWNTTVRTTRR